MTLCFLDGCFLFHVKNVEKVENFLLKFFFLNVEPFASSRNAKRFTLYSLRTCAPTSSKTMSISLHSLILDKGKKRKKYQSFIEKFFLDFGKVFFNLIACQDEVFPLEVGFLDEEAEQEDGVDDVGQ